MGVGFGNGRGPFGPSQVSWKVRRLVWKAEMYELRSLVGLRCCVSGDLCGDGGIGVVVEMERCLMQDQRFAEEGLAPLPVRGESGSRPPRWIGDMVKVSSEFMMLRSTAMRRDVSVKSTVLRRFARDGSNPGQLISRCLRLKKQENPRMNAGTFVAAWKRGGY